MDKTKGTYCKIIIKKSYMKLLKCHCGAVAAKVNAPDSLEKILRCNCSICKRKGAVMSLVKNEDFKIIKGKDKLNLINFTQMLLSITFA